MIIAKPAEDFWKTEIQKELQKRMHPDAWLDLAHSIMIDWRKMKTITTMQTRIAWGLYHLKQVIRTNDIFFMGLDERMGPCLYSCDEGMKTETNCDDTVQDDQFPPEEEALYIDASRIAIERGGPVEFLADCQFAGDIPARVEKIRGNRTLVVIPVYAHVKTATEEREDVIVGALGFMRSGERAPLADGVWMQLFYTAFEYGDAICAAIQENEDAVIRHHIIPADAPIVTTSWRSGVRCLSRWTLDPATNSSGIFSLHDAETWLKGAISSLGYADPPQMKPNELLHSIERSMSRREADEVSQSASETASLLSVEALSSDWNETAGNILNTMGAVFEQTPAIYFAMVNPDSDGIRRRFDEFCIVHSRSIPSPNSEEKRALQVLAQWVGLTGQPLYLAPDERCNRLLQHVRGETTQKMPIFAVPVYGWHKDKPFLHGVFVGFRREGAERPSVAAWLTWVYMAQHMLAPIDAASQHGKVKYKPVNVERSIARAAAPAESMLLPYKSCKAWRKTRPVG